MSLAVASPCVENRTRPLGERLLANRRSRETMRAASEYEIEGGVEMQFAYILIRIHEHGSQRGGAILGVHDDSLASKHFSSKECCHDSIGRMTPGAIDMLEPLPVEVFSTSKETISSTRNKTYR